MGVETVGFGLGAVLMLAGFSCLVARGTNDFSSFDSTEMSDTMEKFSSSSATAVSSEVALPVDEAR